MADYAIVGGGVYGCGLAYELARRSLDVVLFEANEIASGASGGLGRRGVRANGRDLRELPLMRMAYEIWPDLAEELEGTTGYERTGHLLLIERERDRAAAPARAWAQEQAGIPSRVIAADELHELEPHLSEEVIAAIHCPKDGVADHTATTRAYARAARRHGVRIQEQTSVVTFERNQQTVSAVLTDRETRIPVRKGVILCANAGTSSLLREAFDLVLPLWTALPQVVFTAPVDPMPVRHLIGHASRTLAMKANPDGRVMISGGWRGRWNADVGAGETLPDQVAGNVAQAVAVYPCLDGIAVSEAAADRRETISVDGIPIIDRIGNVTYAAGWSGHGWAIAPAVVRLLAKWVVDGEKPAVLAPFGYGRFGGGG